MKATLLTYSTAKQSQKIRDQLRINLNGHTNRSNWGKYTYKREGFLNNIPHMKISKGTIIIPQKETNKIRRFIKKYKAEVKEYQITISQNHFKK